MSVPWSAPEVIAEATAGTVASEVWALGATVYSLLAGHSPFERMEKGQNSRDQLSRRILHAHYPRMTRPDVPEEVQAVLARAMARDPTRASRPRWSSRMRCATRSPAWASRRRPSRWRWMPGRRRRRRWTSRIRPRAGRCARGSRSRVRRHSDLPQSLTTLARDEDEVTSTVARRRRVRLWPWLVTTAAVLAGVGAIVWAAVTGGA